LCTGPAIRQFFFAPGYRLKCPRSGKVLLYLPPCPYLYSLKGIYTQTFLTILMKCSKSALRSRGKLATDSSMLLHKHTSATCMDPGPNMRENNSWKSSIKRRHLRTHVYGSTVTTAKLWSQPQCPSTDEWIKKMWCVYTMEY
jgi:hypothetical protein